MEPSAPTTEERRLLGTYSDGTPVIWDAASLLPQVHRLAELGLIERVDEGLAYRITDAGREALVN